MTFKEWLEAIMVGEGIGGSQYPAITDLFPDLHKSLIAWLDFPGTETWGTLRRQARHVLNNNEWTADGVPRNLPEAPTSSAEEPSHYKSLDPEPLDVILKWGLDFHLGLAVECIAKAGCEPGEAELKRLESARNYLDRRIVELMFQHNSKIYLDRLIKSLEEAD